MRSSSSSSLRPTITSYTPRRREGIDSTGVAVSTRMPKAIRAEWMITTASGGSSASSGAAAR